MKLSHQGNSVKRRRVIFTYKDPQAREVVVSGDFNAWDPSSHPMHPKEGGCWQKIMMLPPGEYEYKFVVDGQWRTDPQNLQQCTNCFGTFNSLLRVAAKGS